MQVSCLNENWSWCRMVHNRPVSHVHMRAGPTRLDPEPTPAGHIDLLEGGFEPQRQPSLVPIVQAPPGAPSCRPQIPLVV